MADKEVMFYKGKKLGYIDFDRECYISERTKEHQFHIFNDGFGISTRVLDKLYEKNITKIIIIFEHKHLFWCDIDTLLCKGKDWNDKGDQQIILPLNFWNEEIFKEKQSLLVEEV
jgi:hypothetical protein